MAQQRLVRWMFRIAGIYGVIALVPQYFLEERINRDFPPAITHPEHFYGFIGVALAWQFAFFVIASAPARYRPLMPVCVLEKLAFGVAAVVLFLQARVPAAVLGFGIVDLVLATAFTIAFFVTPRE